MLQLWKDMAGVVLDMTLFYHRLQVAPYHIPYLCVIGQKGKVVHNSLLPLLCSVLA